MLRKACFHCYVGVRRRPMKIGTRNTTLEKIEINYISGIGKYFYNIQINFYIFRIFSDQFLNPHISPMAELSSETNGKIWNII